MPGIPRSQRCQRCKRRKIKCDEKWPTCTPCMRSDVACSGPPFQAKFVQNGQHRMPAELTEGPHIHPSSGLLAAPSATHPILSIRSRSALSGASYNPLRLSAGPRTNPTTVADQVAARLVGHLDNGTCAEVFRTAGYVKFLPARLDHSLALRDCVSLFCSTWANFQRGVSVGELVDTKSHGKALRSLYAAISNPGQQLSCETLAAITVMERFEYLFDARRSLNGATHTRGMYGLMAARGPPKLNDELDVSLALNNHGALLCYWLIEGGENLYVSSHWKNTLQQALDKGINLPSELVDAYTLELYATDWPDLVRELRLVHDNNDHSSRQARALVLHDRISEIAADLKIIGEEVLAKARSLGRISEAPDPESPVGARFSFGSFDTLITWITYSMLSIVFNRMLSNLSNLLGQPDTFLDLEHADHRRQLLMCIPYIRKMGVLAEMICVPSLFMASENANEAEKAHVCDLLLEADGQKGRYPKDVKVMEAALLHLTKAMTGRTYF